jgi:chromosome segregation ATPase
MRRIQSTQQDPDVEESRAELEHLEGKKNMAQTDVLAIAANKKQLETDFEEAKQRLDTQIKAKREELKKAEVDTVKFSQVVATSKKEAELARDKAIEDRKQADKDLEVVKTAVASQTGKKESLDNLITSLTSIEQRLRSSIAHLAPQERTLEVRKVKLAQEVTDLEKKVSGLIASHAETQAVYTEKQREHEALIVVKESIKKEIAQMSESLASQSRLLSMGGNELMDIQKKRAEHETAMQQRESAANERMANATRLEQRIDFKIAKAIHDGYLKGTTESLASKGVT